MFILEALYAGIAAESRLISTQAINTPIKNRERDKGIDRYGLIPGMPNSQERIWYITK